MLAQQWLSWCRSPNDIVRACRVVWGQAQRFNEAKKANWPEINPRLIFFQEMSICICILYNYSMLRWCRSLKSILMQYKEMYLKYNRYHGCWQPGKSRIQGISYHSIDLVLSEYSSLSTRRFNSFAQVVNIGFKAWVITASDDGIIGSDNGLGSHFQPLLLLLVMELW